MPDHKKENWFKPLYLRLKNLPWKGVFLVLFGILLLFITIQSWLDGYASLNWKITQGRITTSTAVVCRRRYSFSTNYRANIVYEYMVNSISYSSSKISLTSDQFSDLGCGDAEKAMKHYPLGSSVPVYYDPQNPKDSVLIPGGTNFVILSFSLLSLFAGIIALANKKIIRRKIVKQVR